MTIVVAFTVTAAIAFIVHSYYLIQVYIDRSIVLRVEKDLVTRANTLLRVEQARMVINFLLFISGVGVILGIKESGYLIAFIPITSLVASYIALRGK